MTLPLRNSRRKLSQGQLFWRETGVGPTIVFLHGSWHESSQWLAVIEQLHSTYHCLAPDLLGCGESERPAIHYSIDLEVESLAELLEALRVRQVYLVGHSLGSWVAASYALKYLEQVKGLILLAPEGLPVEGSKHRWLWLRWLLTRPPLLVWTLRTIRPLARLLGQAQQIETALQTYRQLQQFPTARQLLFQRRWAEVRAEFLGDRLGWLKVPLLLVQSPMEPAVAQRLGQTYAQLAPESNLTQLAVQDSLENDMPAELAQIIEQFIVSQG